MAIFREKIFGPVLSVMTFNTVEEVVQLANDTHYGLGTGIWSKGIDNALLERFSSELNRGFPWPAERWRLGM